MEVQGNDDNKSFLNNSACTDDGESGVDSLKCLQKLVESIPKVSDI